MRARPGAEGGEGAGSGGVTRDGFLGGRVTLLQPARGHRAGLDAALLAAAVPEDAGGAALDLGCGVGAAAFALAARAPRLSVTGADIDEGLVALGREALALPENATIAGRVRLLVADVAASRPAREAAGLGDGSADIVLMNPPFHAAGRGTMSADPRRRLAHVAEDDALDAWAGAASGLLRSGGTLALIHRAEALSDVLAALDGRFGDVRVLPVHPRAGAPATRIVLAARRGRSAPLKLLPGLVLHEADGRWTQDARALLEGRAALPLG